MVNMRQYGLIGRKLGHSFSARFFSGKFADESISATYSLMELPSIACLRDLLAEKGELCGFNVTIPYKQEVIPHLASATDAARKIGAVNTVRVFRPKNPILPAGGAMNALYGENTDAPGFRAAIEPLLPHATRRALVLGSGGASRAVAYALAEMGIPVTPVSRRTSGNAIAYSDISEETIAAHNLIVNCTPLGMWPDTSSAPDIPYSYIGAGHLCFDLVYNPETTLFMRKCRERGATVSNGLQMLINQALLAWDFWQQPITRRFMSRIIEVESPTGEISSYPLSVAEATYGPDNRIIRLDIRPYECEIPGVEYFDAPLRFRYPDASL